MRGWPDWLFQADAKSLAGALLQWRTFRVAAITAATAVDATIPIVIERDRVFLCEHLSVRVIGGGAQLCTSVYGYHTDSSANVFQDFGFEIFPTGGQASGAFSHFGHYLFPASNGPQLHIVGNFTAGAVANTVIASAAGWVLPRGNINL
jgi:hypothetical protein